ncbi:forkhead-associated domain-containing protein / FHA domain-containing protein [Thalictrum thalictroides]|uniref:Forkhead-associated domain-containing protein / FHA domain-containing protein n=1 Tax=Thalictrum thalictroides TaxID=46969 RepID=A0A7J6VK72_THATH|nr:forkhead-associated domain-containing protein / FHA domain-containing protein [Thalictrum thalictroides]
MAKRQQAEEDFFDDNKRQRRTTTKVGLLYLRSLDAPFISSTTSTTNLFCLRSDRLYTIGRKHCYCNVVFDDPRVSKRHCQIFFDACERKVFILDGFFLHFNSNDLNEVRKKLFQFQETCNEEEGVRPSLNGVFVNDIRVGKGKFVELCIGDEVKLVCANELDLNFGIKIGFVVERVFFSEDVLRCSLMDNCVPRNLNKRMEVENNHLISCQAGFLLNECRLILHSEDPISYIRGCIDLKGEKEVLRSCNAVDIRAPRTVFDAQHDVLVANASNLTKSCLLKSCKEIGLSSGTILQKDCIQTSVTNACGDCSYKILPSNVTKNVHHNNSVLRLNENLDLGLSPGKKFYLNRLDFKDNRLFGQHMMVTLPELLHPVQSICRMFVATFTSDISWFLSYCKVPNKLPVTIACHNTERCWSSSPDKRISTPYEDFPNLVLIYPPFPDVIAFGQDRKRHGIACHHPKFLVLQREDSVRVVVTSANLVSKQWNDVTNTVWWQDFPLKSIPDYSSLFTSIGEETFEGLKSDFAAQLAGFVASLVVDIPSQAHWIIELTKYEFGGANGYLVASVPGMHRHKTPYTLEAMHFLSSSGSASRLNGVKFVGSVEASLVGLKHRFHTTADSNGAALKTLAAFLGKCQENAFAMSEVVLKRNHNIPADANAVSVLICNLDEFSEGEYIQLGFLPRNTAKWVASLCDAGFFSFSAYIHPKEVLAAALEGSNNIVQLILYVSQGPRFSEIPSLLQAEHVVSICSLIASLQRCVGLSRLQEVLGQYKWPELLETDFVYGTSIDSKFLAAFSSAAGKRSIQSTESEESDPEWGRWSANEELKKPSMRIVFPTIDRVKKASCGIWSSRRLLCLSEGTWQRLRPADIFHDAIPHPNYRVGYPMHIKVARRRFQSKTDGSSFGWVYCGSHNFSPAAWGRPTSASASLGSKLHICNYELGIVFIVPPNNKSKNISEKSLSIDDIALPFVLPAPKYRPNDRPATAKAMREAIAELAALQKEIDNEQEDVEEMMDEIPDDDEIVELVEYVTEEREEEKVYAEKLWSQVDSVED